MKNKICFPNLGSYDIPIKYIIENITQCEVIKLNQTSENTINMGSLYSPNDICMPFKYNLGNYLEGLRKGANILIQAGGGCRYGYYAELQEDILKNLGYNFTFINLIKNNHISLKKLYIFSKSLNKKLNIFKYLYYLIQGFLIIIFMDKVDKNYREKYALVLDKKEYTKISKEIKEKYANKNLSILKIINIYVKYKKALSKITIDKRKNPLKILLIGELFTLMEPSSNNNLEEKLLNENIVIYRYTNLSYLLFKKKISQSKIKIKTQQYLKYPLGADGMESVYYTLLHSGEGIDGIIHIKSYACVPELNAIPIISKIVEEKRIPTIYLSFDGPNNIKNIDTKLEAFYDILKSKRTQRIPIIKEKIKK